MASVLAQDSDYESPIYDEVGINGSGTLVSIWKSLEHAYYRTEEELAAAVTEDASDERTALIELQLAKKANHQPLDTLDLTPEGM